MKYNALKFIIIVFFFNLFFIANLININHFNCIAMNLNNVNQFEQPISINETNFPDVNFRKWLTNSNNLNGSGADGIFTNDEIATIEEIYIKADVNNIFLYPTVHKSVKQNKSFFYRLIIFITHS